MNLDRIQLLILRQRLGSSLTLGVVLFIVVKTLAAGYASSSTPSPSLSPSVVTPVGAQPQLADKEKKQLLAEFKKAQNSEMAALKHRHQLEMRELKASQDARRKEWKESENSKRRELFKTEATKSTERRTYFKDRNARWDAFNRILSDELSQRRGEQDARMGALVEQQKAQLREFQDSLNRGERPAARLWPGAQ